MQQVEFDRSILPRIEMASSQWGGVGEIWTLILEEYSILLLLLLRLLQFPTNI